jgi:hypothetical protein
LLCNWRHIAVWQICIQDGSVHGIRMEQMESFSNRWRWSDHPCIGLFDSGFEVHGDDRLILNDQDIAAA